MYKAVNYIGMMIREGNDDNNSDTTLKEKEKDKDNELNYIFEEEEENGLDNTEEKKMTKQKSQITIKLNKKIKLKPIDDEGDD